MTHCERILYPVIVLTCAMTPARAAIVTYQYNDIVSASTIAAVSVGAAAQIRVALDNGGSGLVSQTWTAANLVSVTFDFGGGALHTTFSPPFGGGLIGTTGAFVTNASGELTAVMSSWLDTNVGLDYITNGNAPGAWYLDGSNYMYGETVVANTISLQNVASMKTASNWVLVPGPATLPIFLTGLATLGLARRCRPS